MKRFLSFLLSFFLLLSIFPIALAENYDEFAADFTNLFNEDYRTADNWFASDESRSIFAATIFLDMQLTSGSSITPNLNMPVAIVQIENEIAAIFNREEGIISIAAYSPDEKIAALLEAPLENIGVSSLTKATMATLIEEGLGTEKYAFLDLNTYSTVLNEILSALGMGGDSAGSSGVEDSRSSTNDDFFKGSNSYGNSSGNSTGSTIKLRCSKCRGSGKVECSNCDGKGYKVKYISTPNYSGSTNFKSMTEIHESCFKCSGSGEVTCPYCRGSGVQD